MSKAGIQSNRGDGYQTMVALDWALTVLSDANYQWLEVDSVKWSVDDVVIGMIDGTKICCQCKKNEPKFKTWGMMELADELRKAGSLLGGDPKALIKIYSRNSFGELAALREYSTNYADELAYHGGLGAAHEKTDANLKSLLVKQVPNLSTFEFLRRTTFEVSPELDRMETLLHERLRQLASNPSAAYNALWRRLDYLGMRLNGAQCQSEVTRSCLTKNDLKVLIDQAGAMLTPTMDFVEVRASFQSASAIGRAWRRDIGNRRISSSVVNHLLAAIESRVRSILLTGLPGSGKTCAMLALQEELEQLARTRTDLLPLFIQSREFADLVTTQERQAIGLPEHWVEKVSRMAESAHVVVLIDSLDALSIAREHAALSYFLAQIDRLLQIPNVTAVTACRSFDRHYDLTLAARRWDKELICQPLDWLAEIAPLLIELGIDASATDANTRMLICNPRELALFVELVQLHGSFNVVTSQALAQRYLETVVQNNRTLGETAMQAIEAIANEMLKVRSLTVPRHRFAASQDILRALLSHNVLHETQTGKLTFGHQTLLDVLVISGALRQGLSLSAFIETLPPVPFVRPTIRSFLEQLATDRRDFRKQLRTILTGNYAFHIRRLVAEFLAEQIPHDDDWSLIRDLRNQHREVFQLIYSQTVRLEWHFFWFKHLVPVLNDARDAEGLTTHLHKVSLWKNDDSVGVLAFWKEMLALDWMDKSRFTRQLEIHLSEIHTEHAALIAPLLLTLLGMPRQQPSFLGRAIGRCVTAGCMDDSVLWGYIAGDIGDEDVRLYGFDAKLHCRPHEFSAVNDDFLRHRMQQSIALLQLALTSIEQWSQAMASKYSNALGNYSSTFLNETSYNDVHSQTDDRHANGARVLMDAIERAIVHHAKTESDWWQNNRERLCFSPEGALRYFALVACVASPASNLDVIGRMACDNQFLEGNLSYELGTLIQASFVYLDAPGQDAIQDSILTIGQRTATDPAYRAWRLHEQAQLFFAIPCHLRSSAALAVMRECEEAAWPLVRLPDIGVQGGMVSAPFSFEVFNSVSDSAVLRLLGHYQGHARNSSDDFLIGGEREVGWQLREAASRQAARFLELLSTNWAYTPHGFRDDIMDGVAVYLAHRYGSLQSNADWSPTETPDASSFAQQILSELERHPSHWHHSRAASNALQACAHVVEDTHTAGRLVFLAIGFSTLHEQSSISGDSVDLLTIGINMIRGHVAEALMIVANRFQERTIPWPELLAPALFRFAADAHPAIRALLLRRLPYLQGRRPAVGWELFDLVMKEDVKGLWVMAEPCLYYAYHEQFEMVAASLSRLFGAGNGKDLETWGRISALAALTNKVKFPTLLAGLNTLKTAEAWHGAASVWTHPTNMQQHREQCLAALAVGLGAEDQYARPVAQTMRRLFRDTVPLITIPTDLLKQFFAILETTANAERHDVYGFDAWLNTLSHNKPDHALAATEIYLGYARVAQPYLYDRENNLTQLLTRLFAQAEEQEEVDSGAMLRRVVGVQDALLALGVDGVNDWLKAAERP